METPGNAEKGISQRFLWLIPKPVYSKFDSLQPTDKDFVANIGKHYTSNFLTRNVAIGCVKIES